MVVVALVVLGLAMIYSASAVVAGASPRFGEDSYLFLRRQAIWACAGGLALIAASSVDYRFWIRARWGLLGASFLLLLLPYVPGIGLSLNGAHRWVRIGGYQIQPSEVCKLTLTLALAAFIARRPDRLKFGAIGFLPIAAAVGASAALVFFEPDVGSAVALAAVLSMILFAGGARLKHLAITGLLMAAVAAVAIFFFLPHARDRLSSFFGSGPNYQVRQSVLAVGAGGLLGDGPGAGMAKLFYLPEAQSDFIFAVIGEELGFMGAAGLLLLYGAFLAAAWALYRRAEDLYARLVTLGIAASIILGATINIAVATGTIPAKGIPLPFVSYGGSSLLVSMAAAGILINIASQQKHAATTVGWGNRGTSDARDRVGAGLAPAEP